MLLSASVNSSSSMPSPVYLSTQPGWWDCVVRFMYTHTVVRTLINQSHNHTIAQSHKGTHQWRKALRANISPNCAVTRFHTS